MRPRREQSWGSFFESHGASKEPGNPLKIVFTRFSVYPARNVSDGYAAYDTFDQGFLGSSAGSVDSMSTSPLMSWGRAEPLQRLSEPQIFI